ncbi:sugar phosphate isomerase/epimerase family protein [Pleomorphovibrio marinus]|uniref:sugar phosphate isomerase/epimerase family protein n=1 Tax=Pleomorphovibrio marinus TaxID=2164132 RepID=UPI001E414247|nr:sugar phosphate isomerase/epimerase family protein [Pleomorphovibrio marinus]
MSAKTTSRFYFGACDWSIGHRAEPEAFQTAKAIGLDGLQVSLGLASNNMHLRQRSMQENYRHASKTTGVKIASLAIGELNEIPYKREAITQEWVHDSIDVANALGCTVVLLAFFGKGDLRDDPTGKKEVVRKLKEVAPKAERQGVYLAIESWLSAEEHLDIIEKVGSTHIKVYYDVANSTTMGYNIFEEMKMLGTEYICEVHAKENGKLLGKGEVDFIRVRDVLNEIGYKDWIIIEGAIPKGMEMKEAYQHNLHFLQNTFQS